MIHIYPNGMPRPLTWGKYKKENLTCESLPFFHPGYVLWVLRTFAQHDPEREYLERVIAETDKHSIVVRCGREGIDGKTCDRSATHLSVAGAGSFTNMAGSLYVCGSPECHRLFSISAMGGIAFYSLSFDGLKDLARTNVPIRVLDSFARRLARAWGIMNGNGQLRKDSIHSFFYGSTNG